jgi:[acyl-carrier-protein] S-malonyltransferase
MSGTTALVFPGQGSQYVGMARDLYEGSAAAKALLDELAGAAGFDLLRMMFEGPEKELRETQIAQPVILAHSVAVLAAWVEANGKPEVGAVAGHSLGEYSALVAAGALHAREAVRLVRARGEVMARAGQSRPGTMAAIMKMDAEALQAALDGVMAGMVVIANYNCPGQLVISGDPEAVAAASEAAKAGGGRAMPLPVSGAFHSPLMGPAAKKIAEYLARADMADAQVPVYCNVDAAPHTDAEELRASLGLQLTGSVRWEESVRRMIADGVREFVEVGPKDVLAKLIKRIDGEVAVRAVGTLEQVRTWPA